MAKKRKLGCIYFMQQKSTDGYIKIGFSVNVYERQQSIQTGSPYILQLLAVLMEETSTTEHLIHTMLKNSRIRGEWFYPSKEVMECINYINDFKLKNIWKTILIEQTII